MPRHPLFFKRDPKELKDEDYINFYRSKFPMDPAPLFWIHLKMRMVAQSVLMNAQEKPATVLKPVFVRSIAAGRDVGS